MAAHIATRPAVQRPVPPHHPCISDRQRVVVQHPGYSGDNVLLSLLAADGNSTDAVVGVHFRTVHTACSIIANNSFHGWLSTSRVADYSPVELSDSAILPSGLYFFHVPLEGGVTTPYPTVPNFRSWSFPHGQVPAPWREAISKSRYDSPFTAPPQVIVVSRDNTCRITNYMEGKEIAHILPVMEDSWFVQQGMDRYTSIDGRSGRDLIFSDGNMTLMRADVHKSWDARRFTIVPQPAGSSPCSPALTILVTSSSQELHGLYHGLRLQEIRGIPPEYFFARFAWDIFPMLHDFLQAGRARWLAIYNNEHGTMQKECVTADVCERLSRGQVVTDNEADSVVSDETWLEPLPDSSAALGLQEAEVYSSSNRGRKRQRSDSETYEASLVSSSPKTNRGRKRRRTPEAITM